MSLLPDPCPETGRRLVTVAEWNDRPDQLIDEYAYWFSPAAKALGLDPWRLVEGVERHRPYCATKFDVLFVNGRYLTVSGEAPIYIRAVHYEVLKCGG